MAHRTLRDWLIWQETLNPAEIELGLARMQRMIQALDIRPPRNGVFTIAGTNGKGSCSAAIEFLLRSHGLTTGWYSSPHLVQYNERICLDGKAVQDNCIVDAFERIEQVRGETPLTFFEYGTLAAMLIFAARSCDVWVLEVGLGGRLDAVNAVTADIAVITTIGLDHQSWLGASIDEIATEKAGIIRTASPVFYGDQPVPAPIVRAAEEAGAELRSLNQGYRYASGATSWNWQGNSVRLDGLALPPGAGEEQLRNLSVSLAAIEAYDPALLANEPVVRGLADSVQLPGRYQRHRDSHSWWLDVAHNPQAAAALAVKLRADGVDALTVVLAMQADKDVAAFAAELDGLAIRWITTGTEGYRALGAVALAEILRLSVSAPVETAASVAAALERARQAAGENGGVLVCGSFTLVGPALQALGLY